MAVFGRLVYRFPLCRLCFKTHVDVEKDGRICFSLICCCATLEDHLLMFLYNIPLTLRANSKDVLQGDSVARPRSGNLDRDAANPVYSLCN